MTDTPLPPAWKTTSEHPELFQNGDVYLVALRVANTKTSKSTWEFYTLVVDCDGEGGMEFKHAHSGAYFGEWTWEDVEYYIKCEEL